jgi:AsmA protein
LPAEDLEGVLKVLGYNVPTGSRFQGGAINSSLTSDGPFNRIVTAGQISVTDVRLSGFDLASRLGPLFALGGISPSAETRIQSLSGHIRQSVEGLRVDDLVMVVPPLGTISGAGTVSPENRLDFRMNAKLSAQMATSPLGALGRLVGGGQGSGGGVPFRIEGTTSNPQFVPELGGIGKGAAGRIPAAPGQNLSGALGGLRQRRKP